MFRHFLAYVLPLGLLTGCSTLHTIGNRVPRATEKNPAVRCVCLWQPSEGPGLKGGNTRGFAGQILFFARNSDEPVAVDGDIRIFVFDDFGDPSQQSKPVHEFDYVDGAWNDYLRESQVGVGYHVYVPYTRRTTAEAKCALRIRLTRPDGTKLFSDLTPVNLDGTRRRDRPLSGRSDRVDGNYIQHYNLAAPNEPNDPREAFAAWKARAITIGTTQNGEVVSFNEPGLLPPVQAEPVPSQGFEAMQAATADDLPPVDPAIETHRVQDRIRRIGKGIPDPAERREARVQKMQNELHELFGSETEISIR